MTVMVAEADTGKVLRVTCKDRKLKVGQFVKTGPFDVEVGEPDEQPEKVEVPNVSDPSDHRFQVRDDLSDSTCAKCGGTRAEHTEISDHRYLPDSMDPGICARCSMPRKNHGLA